MLTPNSKKTIAVCVSVLILGVAYWGNYLPLRKSQAFIQATRTSGTARTLEEFTAIMSTALDAPSPVGQPELVRNVANMVVGVLRGPGGKDPRLTQALLDYLYRYYDPLLSSPRGMSFEQDLYILGLLNQISFAQTKDPKYAQRAKEHYLEAHRLGPRRPQPLYGLLDMHRLESNAGEARRVSQLILSHWPDDQIVGQLLADIEKSATTTRPTSTKP